jgi:hypothetical protein
MVSGVLMGKWVVVCVCVLVCAMMTGWLQSWHTLFLFPKSYYSFRYCAFSMKEKGQRMSKSSVTDFSAVCPFIKKISYFLALSHGLKYSDERVLVVSERKGRKTKLKGCVRTAIVFRVAIVRCVFYVFIIRKSDSTLYTVFASSVHHSGSAWSHLWPLFTPTELNAMITRFLMTL